MILHNKFLCMLSICYFLDKYIRFFVDRRPDGIEKDENLSILG